LWNLFLPGVLIIFLLEARRGRRREARRGRRRVF
jgi:hypothetical protein